MWIFFWHEAQLPPHQNVLGSQSNYDAPSSVNQNGMLILIRDLSKAKSKMRNVYWAPAKDVSTEFAILQAIDDNRPRRVHAENVG